MGLTNPEAADHIAAQGGTFEPQRTNNFTVEIALGSADKDLIQLSVNNVALPTEANDIIEIRYQNEVRKVAGQATVSDVNLVINDYVDQDVRGALLRWRKQVYDPATGKVGLARDYKKRGNIVLHGPDGSNTRVCKLKGAWLSSLEGGTLDYGSSDKVQITGVLTVDKVSWAESIPGA